jgi:hypothetical protein
MNAEELRTVCFNFEQFKSLESNENYIFSCDLKQSSDHKTNGGERFLINLADGIVSTENSYDETASSITIYPNPAKDLLTISVPQNKTTYSLLLSNAAGLSLIKRTFTGNTTLDLKALDAGFYILCFTEMHSGSTFFKRLVIE